ncbi:MAG: AmmeMemoRadiSam system radical SAM enzyme [Thermoprotei archaeon]
MSRKPDLSKPWVRTAKYWRKLDNNKVVCNLCYKRCPISDGGYGACGVRYNSGGTLYTLVYGLLTAANLDPIEKKPLTHFHPGSLVFSISTAGCNFMCMFCQNWTLSQSRRNGVFGDFMTPEEVVREAIREGADGISYTYNEPTIFYEFMVDVASLAKKEKLFNTMVTNGYITTEALEELTRFLDAATVDFKASANKEFYRKFMGVPDPEPIYESINYMRKKGVFIEVTNLIIPKYGDSVEDLKKLVKRLIETVGDEVPFHLLRFYPHYKMSYLPETPVKTLEKLAEVAKSEGLKYVYIGNVPGHPLENTYCPNCGELLIRRYGFYIAEWRLTNSNKCPKCGYSVNVVGAMRRRSIQWF